jgi:hypothetical protein
MVTNIKVKNVLAIVTKSNKTDREAENLSLLYAKAIAD